MSTIKVDGIRSNSATSDAITLASDGTCTANITNKPNRNLIINGAMQVAQRGTSEPTASGYTTVDRFSQSASNLANNCDVEQGTISSGGAYDAGFRKSYKVTNGDNNADTNDQSKINYVIESQDLACSGWNSVNSNSKVTLSFWVKSSVAQTFSVLMYAEDASKAYGFEYAATTSWTKITHTISGASGLTFNNDNGYGMGIQWFLYMGTDTTDNSFTNNAWGSYSGSSRSKDMATNWQTTNDATFEITGVQLEVGSIATDFEHRSFGQELQLCARYYQKQLSGSGKAVASAFAYSTTYGNFSPHYPMGPMRAAPSLDQVNGDNYYELTGGLDHGDHLDGAFIIEHGTETTCNIYFDPDASLNNGYSFYIRSDNASAYYAYSAEL